MYKRQTVQRLAEFTEQDYEFTFGITRKEFAQMLEALNAAYWFPEVLFEGCAGGGGRFDAGMLCYYTQIWCSDDTDAIERLTIQHGTSFGLSLIHI